MPAVALFGILVVLLSGPARADDEVQGELFQRKPASYLSSWGFIGGINMPTLIGNIGAGPEDLDTSLRIRGEVGVFGQKRLRTRLPLQLELFFSERGASVQNVDRDDVRLAYFGGRGLIGYEFGDNFRYGANIGVELAVLFLAERGFDVVLEDYESIDFSGIVGAWVGGKRWSVNLRFQQGVIDIRVNDNKQINQTFSLLFSYRWDRYNYSRARTGPVSKPESEPKNELREKLQDTDDKPEKGETKRVPGSGEAGG